MKSRSSCSKILAPYLPFKLQSKVGGYILLLLLMLKCLIVWQPVYYNLVETRISFKFVFIISMYTVQNCQCFLFKVSYLFVVYVVFRISLFIENTRLVDMYVIFISPKLKFVGLVCLTRFYF